MRSGDDAGPRARRRLGTYQNLSIKALILRLDFMSKIAHPPFSYTLEA